MSILDFFCGTLSDRLTIIIIPLKKGIMFFIIQYILIWSELEHANSLLLERLHLTFLFWVLCCTCSLCNGSFKFNDFGKRRVTNLFHNMFILHSKCCNVFFSTANVLVDNIRMKWMKRFYVLYLLKKNVEIFSFHFTAYYSVKIP